MTEAANTMDEITTEDSKQANLSNEIEASSKSEVKGPIKRFETYKQYNGSSQKKSQR